MDKETTNISEILKIYALIYIYIYLQDMWS